MPESKRLFFAIELPPPLQRQIVRWRADHFPPEAGHPVAAANLHLTLAFLGDVSAEKQRALAAMAGRIAQHKFYLGKIGQGFLYLIFCWTFIPAIIAFIEFIIYLCDSDEKFARKYG